jgi:hypothetical protein
MRLQMRTLKFWIRVIPRKGVGKPTQVVQRIYRTRAAATKAKKRGEEVAQATAHSWSQH